MQELYACYVQRISGNPYDEGQQIEKCAALLITHPSRRDGRAPSPDEAQKGAKLLFGTIYYLTEDCGVPRPTVIRLLQVAAAPQDLMQFQLISPEEIRAMMG
jgi:hypothetical protein